MIMLDGKFLLERTESVFRGDVGNFLVTYIEQMKPRIERELWFDLWDALRFDPVQRQGRVALVRTADICLGDTEL